MNKWIDHESCSCNADRIFFSYIQTYSKQWIVIAICMRDNTSEVGGTPAGLSVILVAAAAALCAAARDCPPPEHRHEHGISPAMAAGAGHIGKRDEA